MPNRTCSVPGCDRKHGAKGYCNKHYERAKDGRGLDERFHPARQCAECGNLMPPKKVTGPPAIYCSRACGSRARYKRDGDAVRASISATRAARRAATVRTCPECGATFSPAKSMKQQYCSDRCCNRWVAAHNNRQCSVDGCDRQHRAKGLCAMHWRREARADGRELPDPWSERKKANWKKRESLKRGAPDGESINYRAVFDRDGWTCGLCGDPVDEKREWPHPLSPSLDHITPLSLGGSHTLTNVQLAHLSCNVQKGARVA